MRGQTFHHIADGAGLPLPFPFPIPDPLLPRWLNLRPVSRRSDWVVLDLVVLELVVESSFRRVELWACILINFRTKEGLV